MEDGHQALVAFEAGTYDLILIDMQMPVMDGLSALREIRRREGERGVVRTPAIILTANAMPNHIASALEAGAALHLAKPFTAPDFFKALEDVLSGPEQAELEAA